jgi:hypothetical protein
MRFCSERIIEAELHIGLVGAQPDSELHICLKSATRKIGTSTSTGVLFVTARKGETQQREKPMTRFKILGAAAILTSALASPAIAQQVAPNPNTGDSQRQVTHRHHATTQDRHWRSSYNRSVDERRANRDNVAARAVAGAANTAGAIATAPFRATDAYARDNGYNDYYGYGYGGRDWKTYAARNGLACTPGTWLRGDDGRRYLCQ